MSTFYDFSIQTLAGTSLDLGQFKGKKLMLVNVASECGLTPQYEALQEMYVELGASNFAIIGFPSNDFGAQEPGTADEIQSFCQVNYGVTFPLTEKIQVVGESKHPIYEWLTSETGSEVTWNFQKFLVDENGKVIQSIAPSVLPNDEEILTWIHGNN